MSLPKVPCIELISERLLLIFPEGTENRHYITNDLAVKSVFVMFYAGAVEGLERWIRPSQITDMCDEQASKSSEQDRRIWMNHSLSSRYERPANPWYGLKQRGPLREETIRNGFMAAGAVIERPGLPTITPLPKYAMEENFAELFDETLVEEELDIAILAWQEANLNPDALHRIRLVGANAAASKGGMITAELPTAGAIMLDAGPSGMIGKSIFEKFAPRFLKNPAVLWFSQSKGKVGKELAKQLGIKLSARWSLPDVILVDLGSEEDGSDVRFVFIEIVTKDTAINSLRKKYLTSIAPDANINPDNIMFVSAFQDRSMPAFKNAIAQLAWGTHAWFCSEPNNVIDFQLGHASPEQPEPEQVNEKKATPQKTKANPPLKKNKQRQSRHNPEMELTAIK